MWRHRIAARLSKKKHCRLCVAPHFESPEVVQQLLPAFLRGEQLCRAETAQPDGGARHPSSGGGLAPEHRHRPLQDRTADDSGAQRAYKCNLIRILDGSAQPLASLLLGLPCASIAGKRFLARHVWSVATIRPAVYWRAAPDTSAKISTVPIVHHVCSCSSSRDVSNY